MTLVIIMYAIADFLMIAGFVILIFCPIYEGEPSCWEQWRRNRRG